MRRRVRGACAPLRFEASLGVEASQLPRPALRCLLPFRFVHNRIRLACFVPGDHGTGLLVVQLLQPLLLIALDLASIEIARGRRRRPQRAVALLLHLEAQLDLLLLALLYLTLYVGV